MQFNSGTFLIIGGAGSIGSALVEEILKRYDPSSIRIFDNSDYGLAKISRKLKNDPRLRCLLGDLKDYHRLEMACKGADYIFHLAAIKDISVSEYNPVETIKVNIMGTVNLVECCLRTKPKKVMYLSSDKAVDFSTLYGATKFVSEKITLWGHQVSYPEIVFSCIRLGNVVETRGNVIEVWREQALRGEPLTVTHPDARRYFIHINEAVDYVLKAFELAEGGEVFVPDMDEYRVLDFVDVAKTTQIEVVGLRKGEKLKESLMSEVERERARKVEGLWIIQ